MSDQFTEEERKIFQYRKDPDTEVKGDPLAISRRLSRALDGQLNQVLRMARGYDLPRDADRKLVKPEEPHEVAERMDAEERLFAAVREAFGMTPFDPVTGGGALDADCNSALNCFLRWTEKNVGRAAS